MGRESRRRLRTRRAPANVLCDLGVSRPAHCKARFCFSPEFLPRVASEGAGFRKALTPTLELHIRPVDTLVTFAPASASYLAAAARRYWPARDQTVRSRAHAWGCFQRRAGTFGNFVKCFLQAKLPCVNLS